MIKNNLFVQAISKFLMGVIIIGLLLYIPLIARRIKNEEKVLEEGLEGYKAYKQKVKHKVIPFIW